MTDEELKELAKLECAKLLKSEKGYNGLSYQEFWAEGVKYGWKEKWHDLRKDPSDLPKKDGTYLVSISLSNQIVTDTHEYKDGYFSKYLRIIAWTELPKFEE